MAGLTASQIINKLQNGGEVRLVLCFPAAVLELQLSVRKCFKD